jgi:hypothetical protein
MRINDIPFLFSRFLALYFLYQSIIALVIAAPQYIHAAGSISSEVFWSGSFVTAIALVLFWVFWTKAEWVAKEKSLGTMETIIFLQD